MKKFIFVPCDPLDAYLEKGFTIDYLNNYYNPGQYFDEVYCLSPWEHSSNKIGNITCIKENPLRFSKVIKEIHPNIVRAYNGFLCSDWVTSNRVRGIPVVVSVHDKRESMIYDSLKYADGVICMSEAIRDAILDKVPVESDRIYMLPNRIDPDLFSYKTDHKKFAQLDRLYGSGKHILHVGRKVKEKNLDTVIKALQILGPEYSCLFIGKGDSLHYEKLAADLGVSKQCVFLQCVSHDELPYYYSWCDCMCTPSLSEGFGLVFIEAAACGASVVTSDYPPMNEYFTNGRDSILVKEPQDPNELAAAIKIASEPSEKVAGLRKAARQVGLQFSKDAVDKKEIDIYEQIMKRPVRKRNYWNYNILKSKIRSYI